MNRFEVINAIVDDETITSTQKSILTALWRFSDANGKCYPSIDKLLKASGLKSRKSFYDNRHELVQRGYISIETLNGKGCIYTLLGNKSNLVINDTEPSNISNYKHNKEHNKKIINNINNNSPSYNSNKVQKDLLDYIHSKENPHYSYIDGGWMLELSSELIQ